MFFKEKEDVFFLIDNLSNITYILLIFQLILSISDAINILAK